MGLVGILLAVGMLIAFAHRGWSILKFCELEAPDVEAVRDAYRSAQVELVRAWKAELHAR